jgi:septal ring factor EnvC (AmiA/AmiB activator)
MEGQAYIDLAMNPFFKCMLILGRGKDKEIALLRASLMDRDARLQASKAELLQARRDLQDKDEELQSAYSRLTQACEQRAAVRATLIGTQTELAETQLELDAWTHELATFQQDLADSLVSTYTILLRVVPRCLCSLYAILLLLCYHLSAGNEQCPSASTMSLIRSPS